MITLKPLYEKGRGIRKCNKINLWYMYCTSFFLNDWLLWQSHKKYNKILYFTNISPKKFVLVFFLIDDKITCWKG
jgi:hypothetical protein